MHPLVVTLTCATLSKTPFSTRPGGKRERERERERDDCIRTSVVQIFFSPLLLVAPRAFVSYLTLGHIRAPYGVKSCRHCVDWNTLTLHA